MYFVAFPFLPSPGMLACAGGGGEFRVKGVPRSLTCQAAAEALPRPSVTEKKHPGLPG